MATNTSIIPKSFRPGTKNVNYLGRDFNDFKADLINFTKTYYPQTYKDFNQASPGMMFIEFASYIGDVLSFYTDYQYKESNLLFANERQNVINLARQNGYSPKVSIPAYTDLQVFQMVPAATNLIDGTVSPDLTYAQTILEGMQVSTNSGVYYYTLAPVSFSVDTQSDPLIISVYQRDSNGKPTYYLLQKTVKITAGQSVSATFNFTTPTPYSTITLNETNVIQIVSVTDSDNNPWYQVNYLAQDLVFTDEQNIETNTGRFFQQNNTVPFLLNVFRTSKKFTSYVDANNNTYLEFGPGLQSYDDATITVNLNTIGRNVNSNLTTNASFDPTNFLKTNSYGEAPANTTLTVNYIVGGGQASNVNANELRNISTIAFATDIADYPEDQQKAINTVRRSITVINPNAGVGGADAESTDTIRLNAIANFNAQQRCVIKEDYMVRSLSMPAKYGSISKVYVISDGNLDSISLQTLNANANVASSDALLNPFALNLYTLGYDSNKNLTPLNTAIQQNLINYLNQYRMLTDSVNIINGYIINIGVNFEIVVYKGYNKKQVLAASITAVSNFFNIDYWQFSQPINLSDLQLEISNVVGVQSVQNITISNLTAADGNYSPYAYNIEAATINNVIYPSLDPSVFEVKSPSIDIIGSAA